MLVQMCDRFSRDIVFQSPKIRPLRGLMPDQRLDR